MASFGETPAQQAVLAQRKLEKHYTTIYNALSDYKHSIETVQQVLVWQRPALSFALYAFVHWMFVLQVRSTDGPISQIGNFLFWLMVVDILYRAATKEDNTGTPGDSSTSDSTGSGAAAEGNRRRWRLPSWSRREGRQSGTMMSFEDAVMKRHTPREDGELPSYEVICLWIADVLLILDNSCLLLKHWSINEPLMFSVVLGVPGLVLALLGRYIPTLVLCYVIVMFLLTWPYIELHSLRAKFLAIAQAHYPGVLVRAKAAFNFIKTLALSRSKEDSPEFSLSDGVDEARTEQALQEAFDQATGQQSQRTGDIAGMSLLQDSALGMHPSAFEHADMDSLVTGSLAPGPGEFPSISDLDQSLCLPSFPSHGQGGARGTMPSIGEELEDDDTSLALTSQGSNTDLDPLMDSVEVELGFDLTDSEGRSSNVTGQSRRLLRQAQPSPFTTASTRVPVSQSSTSQGRGYSQGFLPPPTYQAAIDGSDGGITTAGSRGGGRDGYEWPVIDPPMPLGGQGSGAGPRSSSTPLIREGMRRRGPRQTAVSQTNALHQTHPNQDGAYIDGLLQELDTL